MRDKIEHLSRYGEFLNAPSPHCIQDVSKVDTQVRLGKDRLGQENTTAQSADDLEIEPDESITPTRSLQRKAGIAAKGYDPAITDRLLKWSQHEFEVKFFNPIKQKTNIGKLLAGGKTEEECQQLFRDTLADEFFGQKADWGSVIAFASRVRPQAKNRIIISDHSDE